MPIPLLAAIVAAASFALPGGAPVATDYLAIDRDNHRVWIPAGNIGNVDVVDLSSGHVSAIGGFATAPAPKADRPRLGPSSAAVAATAVWVGNRGDLKVCSFDRISLAPGPCVQLPAMPDGLAYVPATHELWASTPREQAIAVIDERSGGLASFKLEGSPEGYAVDDSRGRYYTNLEDKDRTLAIDVKGRKVLASWSPGCGEKGPRGLALDEAHQWLFVACTDGVVALDAAHDGKPLARLQTGAGVDNLDYLPERGLLYVASRADAQLTVARFGTGGFQVLAKVPTVAGGRNAVADAVGTAYLVDSAGGKLVAIEVPAAIR